MTPAAESPRPARKVWQWCYKRGEEGGVLYATQYYRHDVNRWPVGTPPCCLLCCGALCCGGGGNRMERILVLLVCVCVFFPLFC